jgi:hypothetical protein
MSGLPNKLLASLGLVAAVGLGLIDAVLPDCLMRKVNAIERCNGGVYGQNCPEYLARASNLYATFSSKVPQIEVSGGQPPPLSIP